MLTSKEMGEVSRQYTPLPRIQYEAYCIDFESLDEAGLVEAVNEEKAAGKYVGLMVLDGWEPEKVTIRVRDPLGDRKWRVFEVSPVKQITYRVTEVSE